MKLACEKGRETLEFERALLDELCGPGWNRKSAARVTAIRLNTNFLFPERGGLATLPHKAHNIGIMETAQRGRPSLYTEQLASEICERLSAGETLLQISRDERMPSVATISAWAIGEIESAKAGGFPELYARARSMKLRRMAEEIEEIADDGSNDWMDRETERGSIRVVDHEHIQRSKLRVDSRRWLLSKLLPHEYGDRIAHQMLDEHGKPAKPRLIVVVDGAPGSNDGK